MDQSLITPTTITDQLDITPITLRRWCQYHKDHLSPLANPGAGQSRRFTSRDLEVLRHVRSLRDQGMITSAINDKLSSLTFPEIDASTEALPEVQPGDFLAAKSDSTPVMVIQAIEALQRQIEALEVLPSKIQVLEVDVREGKRDRQNIILIFVVGVGVGVLLVVGLLALAALWWR